MPKKDWKTKARAGGGNYLKFKDGQEMIVHIIEGPRDHSFENEQGKTIESLEWDVEVEGESKVLGVSSKRLQQMLADEDDEEPLEGGWFKIKAMGDGLDRQWRVRRIEPPKETEQTRHKVEYEEDERSESAKPVKKPEKPVREVSSIDELEEEAERRAKKPRKSKREYSEEES
jgi:hypothetical protein